MKFTQTSLASSFIRGFALALAVTSLGVYVANAGPFAANISGTNGAGVVSFIMNEAGADVNVVWEDLTTFPMGTLPKGKTNFSVGPHTSWQIVCTKTGNGVPFLISSD